jgi:hypothetical protein
MNKSFLTLLMAAMTTVVSAQQTFTVSVKNPLKQQRTDAPVVISLAGYGDVRSALVTKADGREIPCQLDDLDQDEQFDELCFLANLTAKESHAPILPASMPRWCSRTPVTKS